MAAAAIGVTPIRPVDTGLTMDDCAHIAILKRWLDEGVVGRRRRNDCYKLKTKKYLGTDRPSRDDKKFLNKCKESSALKQKDGGQLLKNIGGMD